MENRGPAGRGWGLVEATRRLLDTADPAEARRRDPQIDRAISSFLAQPAGSARLDDALADQLILLAHHFGVPEAYFVDPDVAESTRARPNRPAESGAGPVPAPARPGPVAADRPATGAAPAAGGPQRRWTTVVAASAVVLAAAAGGGVVGYRMGVGADRSTSPRAAAAPTTPRIPGSGPRVADDVLAAVVGIRVHAGHLTSTGSGVVLDPDGLLLTTDHVIAAATPAGEITVQSRNGTSRPAHIVGRNPAADLAVVAADGLPGLTPIQAGDSDSVRVGQRVLAIGSPLDPPHTTSSVVVGALDRPVLAGHHTPAAPEAPTAIQTDARVGPGAPLVDARGLVIGIETAAPDLGAPGRLSELGSALPVNQALRIAEQIVDASRATPTSWGARVATGGRVAALPEPPGARIVAVAPASPASRAGLKPGDVVVTLDARPVTSGDELVAATRTLVPNHAVTVQLADGRSAHLTAIR